VAWGWPVYLSIAVSPLIGAFFAFFPSIGLRKAPGFTTAIASLALVFILQTVIMNLRFLGGVSGYFGIPLAPGLLPITVGVTILAGIIIHRLDNSRIGRAAETLFYNRDVAACFGVDMGRIAMLLQVLAGALSGLAGAIFAFCVGSIFPAAFGFSILLNIVVMVFVGGTLTLWGAVVFAPILWGIPLILPEAIAEWREVIYGGLLIVILILRPEGVIGRPTLRNLSGFWRRLFYVAKSEKAVTVETGTDQPET
jgi:branched-chain amino acid transport system permease protein